MEIKFSVPSIACNACSGRIKSELGAMSGIGDINIDLKSQTLTVSYDPSLRRPADIRSKIADMGYEVI